MTKACSALGLAFCVCSSASESAVLKRYASGVSGTRAAADSEPLPVT